MKKIILVVILILVLGGGASAFFLTSKSSKHGKEEKKPAHTETVELPEFVVNLADKAHPHYLKITVALEISGEGNEEKMKEASLYVRDAMVMTLSRQKYESLLTEKGRLTLKKELLKCAQHALEEEEIEVTKILIPQFVMD